MKTFRTAILFLASVFIGLSLNAALVAADDPPTPPPTPPSTPTSSFKCDGDNSSGICLPNPPFKNSNGGIANTKDISGANGLVTIIIKYLLRFAGIVAVIVIIYGGYQFMTSAGNEEGATKGKQTLTYAIIGLVIIILAYAIVSGVSSYLINGKL